MEFEKQIKAEENGKVAKPRKEGEISDDELKNVSGGCGDPYTEIYCHKCGWTTKWNGYYPALRGDGEVQKYAGPCPNCGAEYIYAGAYHG